MCSKAGRKTVWRPLIVLPLFACVCGWVSVVTGQVAKTQIGGAIDSNYQIGSGGQNRPVGSGAINSQLYVSGQVSGLARFRGQVGYFAPNELNMAVPSASLSGFRRRSAGLEGLTGSYYTSSYYEPTSTVFGLRGITSGQAAPGTNMPYASSAGRQSALSPQAYLEAVKAYAAAVAARPHGTFSVGSGPVDLRVLPPGTLPGVPGRLAARGLGEPRSFGLAKQQDRWQLTEELYALRQRVDAKVDQEINARIDAALTGREPLGREEAVRLKRGEDQTDADSAEPSTGMGVLASPADDDVFAELLRRMEQAEPTEASTDKGTDASERDRPTGTGSTEDTADEDGQGVVGTLVGLTADNGLILHALAGYGGDGFNRRMTAAAEFLKAGRYYDAVAEYDNALSIHPLNPLGEKGLCIAFFGAGEPLTAAMHLSRAMRLYPRLMQVSVDLTSIMGSSALRRRLAELDALNSRKNVPPEELLLFLAAYVHHNAGDPKQAKRMANALKEELTKRDRASRQRGAPLPAAGRSALQVNAASALLGKYAEHVLAAPAGNAKKAPGSADPRKRE